MKNLLILGGSRFHGKLLVDELANNYNVFVLNRGNYRNTYPKNITHIKIDRNSAKDMNHYLSKINFDIILDNNCYNSKQLEILQESTNLNKTQYIFISSAAIYFKHYSEEMIEESHSEYQIEKNKYSPNIIDYAMNKKECEIFIQKNFTTYTIFRFPNIFGENDFAHKISYYLFRFENAPKVLFEKEIKNFSVIYVQDVVRIIILSILNTNYFNEVFNIASPQEITLHKFFSPIKETFLKKKLMIEANKLWENHYFPPFGWGPWLNTDKFNKINPSFQFTPFEEWIQKCYKEEEDFLKNNPKYFEITINEKDIYDKFNC